MQINLKTGSIAEIDAPLALIGVYADEPLPAPVANLVGADEFNGKFKKVLILHTAGNGIAARRVLLLGLGKRENASPEQVRRAIGFATVRAKEHSIPSAAIALPEVPNADKNAIVRAAAEAVLMANYEFTQFKGTATNQSADPRRPFESVTLVGEGNPAVIDQVQTVFRGVKLARDLGNEPPATCTPTRFAEVAREISERGGMKLTVLDREQMRELGMGGMLGVSQAAHEPPKFIVMEYGQKGRGKTIALVGKGITFDSGGISIKPAEKMDEMKMDMMGAAAVLGTMSVVADLKPQNVHIVGIVCATENLPGGNAFKPGDILKAMNGVTMEIINTDAEGRLVLSDGLSYAVKMFEPDAIIDLATLTGAVVVALGKYHTGLFTNNAELADRVRQAGQATGELVWEMPLTDDYRNLVKQSRVADIVNSAGRNASSITAAAFLEHFVDGRPWVHLDIAGTAYVSEPPTFDQQIKPYNTWGATGVGVRLLTELIQNYAS
jgi:leucyl aminopeptidase